MTDTRTLLLEIYTAGLAAVEGSQVVYNALVTQGKREPCHLIAIGKAAQAMLDGAIRYFAQDVRSALLISKHGHTRPAAEQLCAKVQVIEAAHPVPDASSLHAGTVLLRYIQQLPADAWVVFLISGGTSSLVEVLEGAWTLAHLQRTTEAMLANGATIAEINAMRRNLSRIKGGKLWDFLGERTVTCLLISDVPRDDPAVIGSGLLFPYTSKDFTWQIVANNQQMLAAMAAASPVLPTTIMPALLQGDAVDAAHQCIHTLRHSPPGLYLWGAETTVILPPNPGKGGRNQHLALVAALQMRLEEKLWLLAAGTDGTDGVTEDAGALVDSGTLERGMLDNLDPLACLHAADAGTFLAASGDLIHTGVTGTNVMDVIMGLKFA